MAIKMPPLVKKTKKIVGMEVQQNSQSSSENPSSAKEPAGVANTALNGVTPPCTPLCLCVFVCVCVCVYAPVAHSEHVVHSHSEEKTSSLSFGVPDLAFRFFFWSL